MKDIIAILPNFCITKSVMMGEPNDVPKFCIWCCEISRIQTNLKQYRLYHHVNSNIILILI